MADSPTPRPLVDDPLHIADTETVLRVVQAGFFTGEVIQSHAFQDQSLDKCKGWGLADFCASVALKSIWEAESGDVDVLLSDFSPGAGLAEIPVAALRGLHTKGNQPVPQGVMHDPRHERPWHAVVFTLGGGQRSKAARSAIVAQASWFWHPDW